MAYTEVTQYGEVQGGAVRGGQQVGLQVINVIIDSVTCIQCLFNQKNLWVLRCHPSWRDE